MKLLSIDVGLKNLALCLFQKEECGLFSINIWDVINITGVEEEVKQVFHCNETLKNGKICGKNAKYMKHGCECTSYLCMKHSSQHIIQPNGMKNISKYNVAELKNWIEQYNIEMNDTITTKKQMVDIIKKWLDTCYVSIPSKKKVKNSYTNILLYGRNIKDYFDKIYTNDITHVCIEQQMTSKMRIISYMIAQYFIGKNSEIDVIMCNACYKLKGLETDKTNYDERKKNSVKHMLHFLDEDIYENWKTFFSMNKKQDDLSDAFLQGKWAIGNYNL
jgi:hypothetical protein